MNSQEARICRSVFREDSIMTLPECQDSSESLLHTWAMIQIRKPRPLRSGALLVCTVGDSLLERMGTLHPDFFFSVETVFKEKNKEINFIKYTLTNGIVEQAQQWHQWGHSFYFIFMENFHFSVFLENSISPVSKDLAPYMGFGGGCGATPAGLLQGVRSFWVSREWPRPPCCEWHSSRSKVVSHTLREAHRHWKHSFQQRPTASASTLFQMMNFLMALSLGIHWTQLVHEQAAHGLSPA